MLRIRTIREIAITVLRSEIHALEILSEKFDFSTIEILIDMINKMTGKIVMCGIGKSGHIAAKIAVTICSIGVPAVFLHSAEACHGDLGLISSDDIVIIFSNSGEGYELKKIVQYCKSNEMKSVGISMDRSSFLGQQCDLLIQLPNIPEASELDIPTTSTMLMLALGDMLCIAIKEAKNLSQDRYIKYHPGGKIGLQGMKVSEVMYSGNDLPIANIDADIFEILKIMSVKKLGCIVMVDRDEKVIGIITSESIMKHDIYSTNIDNLIEKSFQIISKTSLIKDIINKKYEHSVVIENSKLVGLVLRTQLMNTL